MEVWRKNLILLWTGTFLSSVGINMIIPFLPFYVHDLGVTDVKQTALWAAFIFAGNHFFIALSSPLWGRLSDKYGQKLMMIRSGIGMGIVIIMMGFVRSPLELLILRMTMGLVAGFITASSTFQAIETPKEHVGKALGVLQTGNVSGNLLGPLIGGLLAETVGIRNAFYITGTLLLFSTLLIVFGVKETRVYEKLEMFNWLKNRGKRRAAYRSAAISAPAIVPGPTEAKAKGGLFAEIRQAPVVLTLFLSTFLISGSFQSIEPIITLYVKSMNIDSHVALIGGMVYAASALGTIVAAPLLGRLADRIGSHLVLMSCLLAVSLLYIPQVWITNPWLLLANRFVLGLSVGGLVPAVSTLLRNFSSERARGSIYGFNQSSNSLGNVCGALFGGFMANHWGIPSIFICLSVIFFLHFAMVWIQWKLGTYTEKKSGRLPRIVLGNRKTQ
ncbi:MFS transporter [Paenibacillus aestuarii]|uniref:MFS transporter n=1 Tax=Paenibacillus aestuarii TaxID=516965 RepID=A0ABW0KDM5_9BACL|nr:MFS transporter [Paenibacillus aestuarii]